MVVDTADDQHRFADALDGQVWTRGLLIRRKTIDGELAFFTTWVVVER